MPVKRTLHETYYALNSALSTYLINNYVDCPFYKYGIDPHTLTDNKNTLGLKYPYIQTFFMNVKQNSRTSQDSGILTNFDYQISFFTAPVDESMNDSTLFFPYEILKNALSDVNLNLIGDIATLLNMQEKTDFNMKSGQPVPSAVILCKMRAVCAYKATIPAPSISTDIDSAIVVTGGT